MSTTRLPIVWSSISVAMLGIMVLLAFLGSVMLGEFSTLTSYFVALGAAAVVAGLFSLPVMLSRKASSQPEVTDEKHAA